MNGLSTTRSSSRSRLRLRLAVCAAVAMLALLCLASVGAAATETGVQIVYRAYQPAELTVLAGQTVTWRNSGLGPHTVTADAGQFDSGTLQTGGSFSYTFSTAGSYAYSCTVHPTMHGRVTVLAGLPAGFPPGASLNAVLLHLSRKHTAHGAVTLVRAQAARPAAKALLQVQSPSGGSWSTKLRSQLSASGATTFKLAGSVHRRVRVVVQGPAGEAALISKPARPPA
ncbi:MAG: cupredoxin domain-containing protein [Solirubrobacteraceae bacterium]